MLAKLAKIANRLDSLGLTKEADILDAYILKVADETVFADNRELVSSDIANNINNELPGISRDQFLAEFVRRFSGSTAKPTMDLNQQWSGDAARTMGLKQWDLLQSKVSPSEKSNVSPTGWEKYVSATGPMGQKVKEAWSRYSYSGAAGLNPTFSSFTSWYNGQMKNVWGGKHKTPSEIIGLLNSLATAQAMAGSSSHSEGLSAWSPDQMGGTAVKPRGSESSIAESNRSFEESMANPWGVAGKTSPSSEGTSGQATRGPAEDLGFIPPEWATAQNVKEVVPWRGEPSNKYDEKLRGKPYR